MAEKREEAKKFKHWRYFVPQPTAGAKSKKRLENGLRIGCGKQPCERKKSTGRASMSR